MAFIRAGTTGKADVDFNSLPTGCLLCRTAGTWEYSGPPLSSTGWDASYEDETVTVPPEAKPGLYSYISVRSASATAPPYGGSPASASAPCKHLLFAVIAADSPIEDLGPNGGCP